MREARKRRASVRRRVGCSGELGPLRLWDWRSISGPMKTVLMLVLLTPGTLTAGNLTVGFGPSSVVISDVTPGAQVYAFGVAIEFMGYYNAINGYEALLTVAPTSTTVEWDIGKSIPLRSVWFALDLASGSDAASPAPGYFPAVRVPFSETNFVRDAGGRIVDLRYPGDHAWFVLVRRGHGVWRELPTDGGGLDDDGKQDGFVTMRISRLQPKVGTIEPAPDSLEFGDVVFVINDFSQKYSFGTIGLDTAASVPSLSEWTLALFALTLGITGFLGLKKM